MSQGGGAKPALRVLVAGGGVAGGLIGAWLARQPGVSVRVVERVTAEAHLASGAGLNVGPNGLRTLAAIWPEKEAELRRVSLPWTQWLARRWDGSVAQDIPVAEVSPVPGIRIRWSELYRVARSDALKVLTFESAVEGAERSEDEHRLRVFERGADGSSFSDAYDWVIAADGRYSRLREQFGGSPVPRHLGIANFRTLLDDGGRIPLDDMEQWFNGPARLISTRLRDGLIFISGNLPIAPGAPVTPEMQEKAFLRRAYLPDSPKADPRLCALVDGFCAPECEHHWARAQEIETRWSDADGRLLYLGDSARAMAPTLAQGATQAVEDAAALMWLFTRWREMGGERAEIPHLTAAFARLRAERVAFVKEFSAEASDVLLAGSDTEAELARLRSEPHRQRLKRLYEDLPLTDSVYDRALEEMS